MLGKSFLASLILTVGINTSLDDRFAELKSAPSAMHAKLIADDIRASLGEPDSAVTEILIDRSVAALQSGDSVLARDLLDRVIHISPDYAQGWLWRARIFIADKKFDQALLDVENALKAEPRYFDAWMQAAQIYEQLQLGTAALAAYEKALEIYPLFPEAQNAQKRLSRHFRGRGV